VNARVSENDFRRGLEELLAAIAREQAPNAPAPYAGAGEQVLHEHDTRIFFFDRFLSLLGWHRGLGGNVAEEARVKSETTKFIDYLGVNDDTRVPALIVEAKAWDTSFVSGVGAKRSWGEKDLIVAAIEHIRNGGGKKSAPVVGGWHDYLDQVAGYVARLKNEYGHEVPRVVLASGRWLLVFTCPVTTFCDGEINDSQFKIFIQKDYVAESNVIYGLLAQSKLARILPLRLRSTQLGNYISGDNAAAAFHAVLVTYEQTGAKLFAPRPRILIYPALLVQRDDGALFTIIDDEDPIVMDLDKADEGHDSLASHLTLVAVGGKRLLARCVAEVPGGLAALDLRDFPGFPDVSADPVAGGALPLGRSDKLFVNPLQMAADQWLVATGDLPHYLLAEPRIACRFHAWSECRAVRHEIGPSSINTRVTRTPRAFFVDGQIYHCAHQEVQDRRQVRCHIAPIDMRTCCKACGFQDHCWSVDDLARLPCGQ
jgi:hypothetical protein